MIFKGIGASNGIAIAKAYKYEEVIFDISDSLIEDALGEVEKLESAIIKSVEEIDKMIEKTQKSLGDDHAAIFVAHKQIAIDSEMKNQVVELINNNHYNSAYAYNQVSQSFIDIFESMDDAYLKERAIDIRDVSKRVLSHILNIKLPNLSEIDEEVIILANDLTPSDTSALDKRFIKGFVTQIGGRTSHTAIMARSMEIPAVVGVREILNRVNDSSLIIIDGSTGDVFIEPGQKQQDLYQRKHQEFLAEVEMLKMFKDKETLTIDNVHVELAANIGSPKDMDATLNNGAEGIGLYRTEFLYMDSLTAPTEEEQFISYKQVLEKMPDKRVVIRTLDIGGDKKLDYLPIDEEANPFLGYRAIRLCLDRIEIFKTQLRALLKASIYGNLHIMFPMIATMQELIDAKKVLEECKNELTSEGIKYDDVKIGIMIEIPSAAILADKFAKEVDFFSIGTNDLIQYTFAADRMNQLVSYLYQPYNPSLLRLIKMVIDASHKEGIWTGMCGEMAGDLVAAPILLGLGLDEFSMSATSILKVRKLFSKLSKQEMEVFANKCLEMSSNEEVHNYMLEILKREGKD